MSCLVSIASYLHNCFRASGKESTEKRIKHLRIEAEARDTNLTMRHPVALMLALTLAAASGAELDESYASAGSEDIYFQRANSIEDQYDEDGDSYEEYAEDVNDQSQPEKKVQAPWPTPIKPTGDNIEGLGENEISCEYSCPRYYRPVCVRRNGKLITYATPCEYQNRLRCANVTKRLGRTDTPTYELVYYNACRENRK